MAYLDSNGAHNGEPFEFKALGAETTSTTHLSRYVSAQGNAIVTVKVTAATGTTPTLLVTVQGSVDGANWITLGKIGASGYSVGPVATAPTNLTAAATASGVFPLTPYVRTTSTVGGTTPSFTYSVEAALG